VTVSNISTNTNKNKQPPLKTNNHLSKQATTSQNKQPPLKTNNHLSKQTTTSQNKQPPLTQIIEGIVVVVIVR
jgi:hypothetical protein